MLRKLVQTLAIFLIFVVFGGVAYYFVRNWTKSKVINVASKEEAPKAPSWFNKLKNVTPKKISSGLQAARSWANATDVPGYQKVASNWADLICNIERSATDADKEFCQNKY